MTLNKKIILKLTDHLGAGAVLTDPSETLVYNHDTSRYHGKPDAVIFPTTHEQVTFIVKICYENKIPLYCRGKGTATTGASVPTEGGIVLSMERMNKIIKMDPDNRVMVVEPGVINQDIQNEAAKKGFFWAPDPASASVCCVGGNLACNAAGPRAVKYGTCRENTLGLKAVTGTGETIHTGVYTTKGVVGFDLTRLLIGSEGSLAVITQANLKLLPLPESKITLQAIYKTIRHCTKAISAIMAQPIIPCALEFMDKRSIDMIRADTTITIPEEAEALLMIEVDGLEHSLEIAAKKVAASASNDGLLQIKTASTADETQALWKMRKSLSPALRKVAPKKINEDVVVPVSTISEFIAYLDDLSNRYHIPIVNFGHAGNGNIHVNLMIDPSNEEQSKNETICLEKMFDKVLELGGTLSGEHGVGLDKRDYIKKELDAPSLKLMHQIKKAFDPAGIMNPGKVLPSEE